MRYPPIKSGIGYEVWRWREDVAKWCRVSKYRTFEEAQKRRAEEVASGREIRITETTYARREGNKMGGWTELGTVTEAAEKLGLPDAAAVWDAVAAGRLVAVPGNYGGPWEIWKKEQA
jgi:hypothetical protein